MLVYQRVGRNRVQKANFFHWGPHDLQVVAMWGNEDSPLEVPGQNMTIRTEQ